MTDCDRYRELISELVDGELAEPLKTELESHLSFCPECAGVYHAFALISSSISGELSEPPASLADDVMRSIRAGGAAARPAAKRVSRWGRAAALAACLALVIFAGARTGVFQGKGALPANGNISEAYLYDVESAAAEEAEPTFHGLGTVSADTGESSGEAPAEEPLPAPIPEPPDRSSAEQTDVPIIEAAVSEPPLAATSSSVRVFSGGAADGAEPIAIFADEESVAFIMGILAFSEAGDDIPISGEPLFTVETAHPDGTGETIAVYVIEGRLCCVRGGEVYAAAGDISDLIAFISAA